MTAVAVLAEARALGVVLTPDGESLRYRGRLPAELRTRIAELKPELLALLRAARQTETAAVWSAAFGRLVGQGWPGRHVVKRLRPPVLADIDSAEAEAERLTIAYRGGKGSTEAYVQAIAAWETLVRDTITALGGLCHECGQELLADVMDPSTGERFCAACRGRQERSCG